MKVEDIYDLIAKNVDTFANYVPYNAPFILNGGGYIIGMAEAGAQMGFLSRSTDNACSVMSDGKQVLSDCDINTDGIPFTIIKS